MHGAETGVRQLRELGIPLGIVTNGPSKLQRGKIEGAGLHQLIDEIFISEEFGSGKPDAAIFHAACRSLKAEPATSWFVGDNPSADIIGAHNAGLRTIWLERSLPWPEDEPRCATHHVTAFEAAMQILLDGQ
jgi:putative hydrolase of the HAD superfamily